MLTVAEVGQRCGSCASTSEMVERRRRSDEVVVGGVVARLGEVVRQVGAIQGRWREDGSYEMQWEEGEKRENAW